MQKPKHTPGPWKVGENRTQVIGQDSVGPWQVVIADTRVPAYPKAEQEANAQLIAAAPELLRIIRAFAELVDEYGLPSNSQQWTASSPNVALGGVWREAHKAIAQAEGRASR